MAQAVDPAREHGALALDRRSFIKIAGAQAGLLVAGARSIESALGAPAIGTDAPDVVVIGAGAFGGWTALSLRKMGMRVMLVDAFGPGNSRATSGDETRGVRSSYGDRTLPQGEVWTRWARQAMTRWRDWDAEWGKEMKIQLFFTTGDLILREDWEPFLTQTKELWDKLEVPYEVLAIDEVRYRYPVIDLQDIQVVLFEPDAGVVRSRRACESVAGVFRQLGGDVVLARAWPTVPNGRRMRALQLSTGALVEAETFVFACGPWLPKVFPELLGKRMRTPLGNVFYFGSAPGDDRFTFPNMPSWNFPGVTGWPALPPDNRGFRVRTGGGANSDPDLSPRWIPPELVQRGRAFVAERFPVLANAPLIETRSCHYELSVGRNFIVDRHPDMENVWIVGAGSAEGFKFGPVIGEYAAGCIAGRNQEPELAAQYRIPTETYDAEPRAPGRAATASRRG